MHDIFKESALIFTKNVNQVHKFCVTKSDKTIKNYLLYPQVRFFLSRISYPSIQLFKVSGERKKVVKFARIFKTN